VLRVKRIILVMAGSVTELDLSQNRFTSSIPTELGRLSRLQSLYLSRNQLDSTIPTRMGLLTDLKALSLDLVHLVTVDASI
jgi:Leucine-rich repeat (LRR) protein